MSSSDRLVWVIRPSASLIAIPTGEASNTSRNRVSLVRRLRSRSCHANDSARVTSLSWSTTWLRSAQVYPDANAASSSMIRPQGASAAVSPAAADAFSQGRAMI